MFVVVVVCWCLSLFVVVVFYENNYPAQVKDHQDFDTSSAFQGLRHWRLIMSATEENSFIKNCQQNLGSTCDLVSDVERNAELRLALIGDNPAVITPCRGPPSSSTVRGWAQEKLAARRAKILQARAGHVMAKTERGSTGGSCKDEVHGENVVSEESGQPKGSMPAVIEEVKSSATESSPVDMTQVKIKGTDAGNSAMQSCEKDCNSGDVNKPEVIVVSDSSSSAEITSPCSLFSPVEGTFTFSPDREPHHKDASSLGKKRATSLQSSEDEADMSVRKSEADNSHLVPLSSNLSLLCTTTLSKKVPGCREPATGPASLGTPSSVADVSIDKHLKSPVDNSGQSVVESPRQPMGRLDQGLQLPGQPPSPLAAPQHSTPVSSRPLSSVQSPRCTPIEVLTVKGSERTSSREECYEGKHDIQGPRRLTPCDQTALLRRQLLSTQLKVRSG